jgi:hypothetical protein
MIFTILAYKPDTQDVCRGCVVARYSSDFKWKSSMDKAVMAEFLAEIQFADKHCEHGESSYEVTFLFNGEEFPEGETDWMTEELRLEITKKAEGICTAKLAEEDRLKAAQAAENNRKAQEAKEKQEREQLVALRAKYPNA